MIEKRTRSENATINIFIGIIYQCVIILTGFVLRRIFVRVLNVEYLGINGILNNILSILSLSELGISSAIIYSLYKPIAENNTKKISALIQYYHKLYNIIAIIITILGIFLIPFLKYIIKLDLPMYEITIYYIMFLANTVVSYLYTYKTAILIANQKEYICKKYMLLISVLQFIIQILILLLLHNFFIYISVQIIFSFLSNYITSKVAEKTYPYIKEKIKLEEKEKKEIWENIKSMFMYKIGGVVLNNTDNILISIMLGTVVVGYYSNYSMILVQVSTICGIIFTSMQASLGNLSVEENNEKKYFVFKVLQLMSHWIFGFCSICFAVLFQDFITLWLGKNFLLDNKIVYICIINFYIQGILFPILCYRNTVGLFKNTKHVMIFASIINLILSIIAGKIFGLIGILGATAVSRLLTNSWYEPYILFKKYFNISSFKYYIAEILSFVLNAIFMILIVIICNKITEVTIFTFALKLVICIVVPNILYYLIYKNREEFKYIKEIILKKTLLRVKNKIIDSNK